MLRRRLYRRRNQSLTEIGIPAEVVEVVIHEIPMENWGAGGE
jgi:phenylpyruvate tautomerase PptA (4-oxalocrotonate tautomerase family)